MRPRCRDPTRFCRGSRRGQDAGLGAPIAAGTGGRIPDIFLGTSGRPRSTASSARTPHFGRTVALDLNETHTISLFGVQGGGKSYTLGSIIEAATLPAPPVNQLPSRWPRSSSTTARPSTTSPSSPA